MKTSRIALVSSLALALAVPTFGQEGNRDEVRIASRADVARALTVTDLSVVDGAASGVLVNRSSNPVKNTRVAVAHQWLWNSETRPGTDDQSRTEYFVIPDEIPPGGSVRFNYRPSTPLPQRSDGHFMTVVEPAAFVEIVRADSPTRATSGVGGTAVVPSRPAEPSPGVTYEPPVPRAPSAVPAEPPPSAAPSARPPAVPY